MPGIQESTAETKFLALKKYLKELGSVAVAFSGGVDSVFLLKTAKEVFGDKVLAVTANSCFFPEREDREADEFCKREGIRHIKIDMDVLDIEGVPENPKNRCYLCKRALFRKILKIAEENHIKYVAEGSNMDDMSDDRPGLLAIQELGVKSPLKKAGLYKEEIRLLSKKMNLPTWNKPSLACLATRVPYGDRITEEKLAMVEQAEQLLFGLGFHQVRVRIHGKVARIEILPEEFERLMKEECRKQVTENFTKYGFTYISLDLKGYQMGNMNKVFS